MAEPEEPTDEGSSLLSSVAFESVPPPAEFGRYEFGPYENNVIAKAAARTRLWGAFSIVIGLAHCVLLVPHQVRDGNLAVALTQVVTGLTGIVVGLAFLRAARSLEVVVVTEGDDIEHMMAALHTMGKAFLLQTLAALVAVATIVAIFFTAMGLASLSAGGG